MVKQFNKNNLPKIKALMNSALKDVGNQFGIEIEVGNGSYTSDETTFKVKLSILDEDGDSKQDKSVFILYGVRHGFSAEDFGKDFTYRGGQFKITGWSRRRWKLPVATKEISTGRTAYFPPRTVLQALGKPGKTVSSRTNIGTFEASVNTNDESSY